MWLGRPRSHKVCPLQAGESGIEGQIQFKDAGLKTGGGGVGVIGFKPLCPQAWVPGALTSKGREDGVPQTKKRENSPSFPLFVLFRPSTE